MFTSNQDTCTLFASAWTPELLLCNESLLTHCKSRSKKGTGSSFGHPPIIPRQSALRPSAAAPKPCASRLACSTPSVHSAPAAAHQASLQPTLPRSQPLRSWPSPCWDTDWKTLRHSSAPSPSCCAQPAAQAGSYPCAHSNRSRLRADTTKALVSTVEPATHSSSSSSRRCGTVLHSFQAADR